jgi:hypothetical protein
MNAAQLCSGQLAGHEAGQFFRVRNIEQLLAGLRFTLPLL